MGWHKDWLARQEELEPFYEWLEYRYEEGEVGEEGTESWSKALEIWEHEQELQPFYEWLDDNYGEDVGEEGTESWNKAFRAFEDYHLKEYEELEWYINTQTQEEIFDTEMRSVSELLHKNQLTNPTQFSLLVMLHGHTVAAVESYLASTFIHTVTNSDDLIKKLVETDPVFSKKKFTLQEIFEKQKNLKLTVAKYLKNLVFHNIKKVKPMFNDVLDCDFGDVKWLYEAVGTRHDCVHRAGLKKDGKRIDVSIDSIQELVDNSKSLVQKIEDRIEEIKVVDHNNILNIFST